MANENIIDHNSLTSTIVELNKIGEAKLVDNLQQILTNNEIRKPEKHNKIDDKTTSYYEVTLKEDELETIVDLFRDLEVKYLGKDYGPTSLSTTYADMADRWANIKLD